MLVLARRALYSLPRTFIARRLPQAAPSNKHLSIGPNGEPVYDLTFTSEPLGISVAQKCGWAQFDYGETIGPSGRYTIACKLGWGMHSSTWLARDSQTTSYVAIKALTGYMTAADNDDQIWEQDALRGLACEPLSPHCLYSLDEFTVKGKGSAGEHLCMVTPLLGGDVKALGVSLAEEERLELVTVKRILLHTLHGLAFAHSREILHTDIKADNIFFRTDMSTASIDNWLAENPPRRHDPEFSNDGITQSAVSQPLPMISRAFAREVTYVLGDWGCAQPSKLHPMRTITPPSLRPPEVFLGADWDKPADVWAFGCLVYELISSGRPLFLYTPNEKHGLTEDENILYQMLLYTGSRTFPSELLNKSPRAPEFFNATCLLHKKPPLFDITLWNVIVDRGILPDGKDADQMTEFLDKCLCINPAERATAQELLKDPWFADVD